MKLTCKSLLLSFIMDHMQATGLVRVTNSVCFLSQTIVALFVKVM